MRVKDGDVTLEGLGTSASPSETPASFRVLNDKFRRQFGFEADIGVYWVTLEQCPAVNFLSRVKDQLGTAPRLDIDASGLRNMDPLSWRATLPLWLPRLSMMTMSPGFKVGMRAFSTQIRKVSLSIGPSRSHDASIRSWRRAATNVVVFQRPCGTLVVSVVPRPAQPRGGMLVLVQG